MAGSSMWLENYSPDSTCEWAGSISLTMSPCPSNANSRRSHGGESSLSALVIETKKQGPKTLLFGTLW